jgi:phosphoglucosamine mutase
MSNLGLERYMESIGLRLIRTAVGDRYVTSQMREGDYNLGGEQSGHIILRDFATTGDGCLAALSVLAAFRDKQRENPSIKASEALQVFDRLPQILKNVRYDGALAPLDDDQVVKALAKAEKTMANDGRLVVRASGTEPVIRVMAEGDDPKKVEAIVDDLCAVIEQVSK